MRKPTIYMMLHTSPSQLGLLASSLERAIPEPTDLMPKTTHGSLIRGNTVITKVPADDRSQPFALLRHRVVHALSELGFYIMKFRSHLFLYRLPQDRELPIIQRLPTNVSETKEVKSFWYAQPTLFPVASRKSAKFQNSRFLGMKLKTELEHTLFEFSQKLLSLRFMFKTHNKVVGPSFNDQLTARFVLLSLLRPKIQDKVKVNVRKQWADGASLRHTLFCLGQSAILHDPRLQLFLDQADYPLIANAMFDKLDQPAVVEIVEKSSDVMLKVSDPAEYSLLSPLRAASCCLPRISRPSALGFNILSGLNTWPMSNPVNASSTLSQAYPHDSGSLSMASRLKVNRITNNQSAGLSRRTEIP